jgi:hypothetical protein
VGQHAGEREGVIGEGLPTGKGAMARAASSNTSLVKIQQQLLWTESMRDMQRDIWGHNFVLALDLRGDFTGRLEVPLPPDISNLGVDVAHIASMPR